MDRASQIRDGVGYLFWFGEKLLKPAARYARPPAKPITFYGQLYELTGGETKKKKVASLADVNRTLFFSPHEIKDRNVHTGPYTCFFLL
jgi:hypothetical protein